MIRKLWKVETRTHCLICGALITEKRYRTFCSKQCRNKNNNIKRAPYNALWATRNRARYEEDKLECKICGGYYN